MSLVSFSVIAGAALAVLAGVSLGLLGGGGSILTVPILVYVIGVPAHEAVSLSLAVVGATSVVALIPHARRGHVRWKTGALFGATSMAGAYVAAKLAHHLPSTLLLLMFGVLMLVTAAAMMRRRDVAPGEAPSAEEGAPEAARAELPLGKIVLQGIGVGAITGLLGAGGGFLVVPALVLMGKLPMRSAVGTSLLVIAMNSGAGLVGHAQSASIDWPLAALITAAAMIGSVGGSALAERVPQQLLRRGFAWFIVVMSVAILLQELPRAVGAPLDLATWWPLLLGATAVPAVLAVIDLVRGSRVVPTQA